MPMRHREQRDAAAQHVAALAYEQERADERGADAGGHDQGGERAHDRNAAVGAGGLAIAHRREPCLDRRGHLQCEQSEHRQSQHHEQRGKQHDDPGLLECRLDLLPAGGDRDSGGGVGQCHSQHVGQREAEASAAPSGWCRRR